LPDLNFDKSKFTCKYDGYCFGKSANISDTSIQPRAQEYRRKMSSSMRAMPGTDIQKLPRAKGYYVTRKYDGEFAMLFFDGETIMSSNAGGTIRVGLPAYKEAETLLKKAKVGSCILGAEIYLKDEPTAAQRIHQVVTILRDPKSKAELGRLGIAIFDVIEAEGKQVTAADDVFKLINKWFADGKKAHAAENVQVDSVDEVTNIFNQWVVGEGSEGLVLRHDRAGWFKLKSRHNLDVAIIGFTAGTEGRKELIHDILVAVMRDDGTFHELGRTGGGFTEQMRRDMLKDLRKRVVPSDYVAVNNDYVAYEMVKPGIVIEISCLDLIPERSNGGPVNRMVLEWDGKRYNALERMPIVSMISPQFVRIRDDKEADPADINIRQINALVEVPRIAAPAKDKATKNEPSELLKREVYTKTMKGSKMVRKLLMWKTNKQDETQFPAFVVYLTDFSPNRANPLERDIKVAHTERAAKKHFDNLAKAKFVGGWQKAG
jgi:ATP-dependent DNA ligase